MTKNEIVTIALKILGIYVLILGLSSISAPLRFCAMEGVNNWSFFITTFIFIVSGLILIFKAESISKLITRSSDGLVDKIDFSENIQKAALRVIGIYVAVFTLPSIVFLFGEVIQYKIAMKSVPEYFQQRPNFVVPMISQMLRLIIGIYLALGADTVIRALGRFDKTFEKMNK